MNYNAYKIQVINEDNMKNVQCRTFRNKNIWDLYGVINEFKKGYQPITNIAKDENGNLLADSYSIWINGWITSVTYWMHIAQMTLSRQKCI